MIKRRWQWLLPALFVLAAVVAAPQFLELHYSYFDRPALLTDGGVPCAEFHSEYPREAPRSCDLALAKKTPDGTRLESFYFLDGSTSTLTLKSGRWRGSSAECGAARNGAALAMVGMVLLGIATLSQAFRTGQWFYFPGMKRHPMNDFEAVVGIYGVAFFGGQMISMVTASCEALGRI